MFRKSFDYSDYDLLSVMKGAMRSLSSTRGSHTQVFEFEGARLGDLLADLAGDLGADRGGRERARRLGVRLAGRFLLKVGNIYEYVVKLSGGRESLIHRHLMSEAFGPAGYNLAPGRDKVHLDAREAAREIPYFAFGAPEVQFTPDVLDEVRATLLGRARAPRRSPPPFLIEESREGRTVLDVYRILDEDPYFQGRIRGQGDLVRFQRYLREHPVDAAMRERLAEFFDAPLTVGVRDVLRFLEGSRHPEIGWEVADRVIRQCFDAFGTETFLPPEVNYYTVSIHQPPDQVATRADANERAARAFASWFVSRAPLTWTARRSDGDLLELALAVLEAHHDYPIFDVEPYTGIASTSGLRLAGRVAFGALVHATGLDMPERRNPIRPTIASRFPVISAFVGALPELDRDAFYDLVNALLVEAMVRGGIPDLDGNLHPFTRIDRTFYSFQERAEYPVARAGRIEEVVTLEDLLEPPGRPLLDRHPDLPAKLVVFFVLVYRYFLDTGHVPDLRPDDAGRDLFLRGIWGYKTRNVLVATGQDRAGRPIASIRFVDNKDQFKQYRRAEDRSHPMGLAKYGARLIHPLIQPAMERSIGMFTGMAASRQDAPPLHRRDLPARWSRSIAHVLHSGVDGAVTHVRAFLHDLIDDTTDGIEAFLRRW